MATEITGQHLKVAEHADALRGKPV